MCSVYLWVLEASVPCENNTKNIKEVQSSSNTVLISLAWVKRASLLEMSSSDSFHHFFYDYADQYLCIKTRTKADWTLKWHCFPKNVFQVSNICFCGFLWKRILDFCANKADSWSQVCGTRMYFHSPTVNQLGCGLPHKMINCILFNTIYKINNKN